MSETRFTLEITNPIFTVSEKWLVDELREVGMKFANYHNGFMFRDAENGSYIATRTNCIIELRFGEGEAHMNGWHALQDLVGRIGPITFRPLADGILYVH